MNATPPPPAADDDGAAILDLERFIPYQLSVLSNVVSQEIAEAYGDRFGLAITEWRILAVLGRFPGMSAVGVAERSAMDKVAVSRAVARLLERGLLHRETHGDDRRRSVLELSDAGREVYSEVAPLALSYERELLAPLSDEERLQFSRMLDRLGERYGL
ncbi:MarR family transcriptional regulator [Luteimonas sp. MC1750]|uniref:MarR family winged helix-turn-helix transcriptional regulator n=1 Tax=Luteimonas sp. MC1750 TaxID=2799326 RepID=UPI0018F0D855|nr:MarR family transcriptional regulator [Luteimonas sp. MC1750]MBJ6984907.1 MarR family transcriptional regulator [Luteimonas sp. MC1750]QQO05587.1 MarR family transcriptional regulator [Luteimonas sp. MC1750]